ncbi:glycine rich domain-containing protein [Segatella albensis]|nr:glycine rich domain-containing protein [Segatella albensis]
MQEFTAPIDGVYKLEVWGASGGDYNNQVGIGGKVAIRKE